MTVTGNFRGAEFLSVSFQAISVSHVHLAGLRFTSCRATKEKHEMKHNRIQLSLQTICISQKQSLGSDEYVETTAPYFDPL